LCGAAINDVPAVVTVQLIASLLDDDVPDFIFQYARNVLAEHDCYQSDGPDEPEILATLPIGLRAGYALVLLDSEVHNGGFYQWFTNSSGRLAKETLKYLQMIGATEVAQVVEEALRLNERLETKYTAYKERWKSAAAEPEPGFWPDVEANFEPEFDRLSNDFFSLDESDSIWTSFIDYVRKAPVECVHRRLPMAD
jgi:hypothetical protein